MFTLLNRPLEPWDIDDAESGTLLVFQDPKKKEFDLYVAALIMKDKHPEVKALLYSKDMALLFATAFNSQVKNG